MNEPTDSNESRMQFELGMLRKHEWNVAFKTLDGLTCFGKFPDPSVTAIMRSIKFPMPPGAYLRRRPICRPICRRYDRTLETYCGLPLFQEVET